MKAIGVVCVLAMLAFASAEEVTAKFTERKLRRQRGAAGGAVDSDKKKAGGGITGIDISGATCDGSQWISTKEWPCFKNAGATHAIVESHNGGMGQTQAIAHCTSTAAAAGFTRVDLYSFWCPNCGGNNPPKQAMANHVQWLKKQGVKYDTLWVDVETCQGCWNSASENVAYLRQLVEGAASAGAKVGIYTNANEWASVCGSDSSFSGFPLWYAQYDGSSSFSDFRAFGGWTKPFMKQWADQSSIGCFSGVDMDWRP